MATKKERIFTPHDISQLTRYIGRSLRGYYNFQMDEKYQGKGADEIIKRLLDERGFNDYSGNLSRSYFVKVNRDGASYTFAASDNAARPPKIRQTKSRYLYYLTKKRHYIRKSTSKRKDWTLDRKGQLTMKDMYYRAMKVGLERGPGAYRYLDKLSTRRAPKRGYQKVNGRDERIVYTVEVGNDTPYAPMVQNGSMYAKPYNVISPRTANEIRRKVQKDSYGIAKAAVRNMVYDINKKGYSRWRDNRL